MEAVMAEAALRMGADNGDASKRPIYGALAAAALNQDPQKGVGLGLLSKDRGTAAILNGGHFEVRRRRPFDTRLLEAPRAGHADSGTTSSSRPLQGAGETGTDRGAASKHKLSVVPPGRTPTQTAVRTHIDAGRPREDPLPVALARTGRRVASLRALRRRAGHRELSSHDGDARRVRPRLAAAR